ncbi:MAG: radical SAM protein [Bacillota bacterium]
MLKDSNKVICTGGLDSLYIDYEGNIFRCHAHTYNPELRIGHILNFEVHKINPICQDYKCTEICDKLATQQWVNGKKITNNVIIPYPEVDNINDLDYSNLRFFAELVNGCTNKCPYCFSVKSKNFTPKFINSNDFLNFCSRIFKNKKGIKSILFDGLGDSISHPDFEYIVDFLIENNIGVCIITSGINYIDVIERVLNNLTQKNKLHFFSIINSLHISSHIWDNNKFIDLLKVLKKYNVLNKTIYNFVNHYLNNENFNKIEDILDSFGIKDRLNIIECDYNACALKPKIFKKI